MKKSILILGGTMFAGRLLVEKLIAANLYQVTLFNRGKSNHQLFPDIQQIHGNRESDAIQQIFEQHWDVIIDFSGYYPVTFQKLIQNLRGKVGRYIFISTISVFPMGEKEEQVINENSPTLECTEEQMNSTLPDAYGEKKAEMERILLAEKELDSIIFRPSFIYGKYDFTDRFYYWLYRAKHAQKIILPETKSLSLTYVEDLANAILNAIEISVHKKYYNAISQTNTSIEANLKTTAALLDKQIDILSADEIFLKKHELDYYNFPLCLPFNLDIEGTQWLQDFSVKPKDFKQTILECIAYYESNHWPSPKTGISLESENAIIEQQ
jgi:2'-hydroxyisoflavone reductase